jgi:single-stranded-DNA-specific exonuclease
MTAGHPLMTATRWVEPAQFPDLDLSIADHPLLARLLHSRDIRSRVDADQFLTPLRGSLSDPTRLPDIDRAVSMILAARDAGTRIVVFGDYDVDGLTSTAMLTRVLRRLGADVEPIVPHRINDGYGVTMASVERIVASGAGLVVAVDCGSSSPDEFAALLRHGIQAVVLDHHHYTGQLPDEVAFVSPKRPDNRFPFMDLAGVGVAYMLVRLLLGDDDAEMYLPYVALGSVADVVELRAENRILVAKGISKLRRWKLPGLMALCSAAGIDQSTLTTWHIGFVLGPRLNAAGRVDSPQVALDLLLADDLATAVPLALKLSDLNEQRQAETRRIQHEAEQLLDLDGAAAQAPAIVVADATWSTGIAGLVASRLAERYGRPAIVLERGPEVARGSARSIPGIDIVEAIGASRDILDRFGGHAAAAGLSLPSDQIDTFRRELAAAVMDLCGGRLPEREVLIDAEVMPEDLHLATVDTLGRLEPFGRGNEQPLFIVRNASHRYARLTRDGRHITLQIVDSRRRSHRAIFFGAGPRMRELLDSPRIDVVTTLERDTWDGRESLKLFIRDFRPAS